MYMGELVRCVLADLCRQRLLFEGHGSKTLNTPHTFDTAFVSYVESDNKGDYTETRKVLEEKMGLGPVSDEDCDNVKLVCARVSTRAAYMVSAAVATILNKIKRPHTTVGVDGSVYRYHPHFHSLMEKKIAEIVHPEYKFDLMLSEDGSGRGAALVAAVAVRQKLKSQGVPCK